MTEYEFNWDIVAKLDPEYKDKYLEVSTHNRYDTPINQTMPNNTDIEQDIIDEMHENDDTPIKHCVEQDTEILESNPLKLKNEYQHQPYQTPTDCLQLMPPKRVLAEGSTIRFDNMIYKVTNNKYQNRSVNYNKQLVSTLDDKIRLVSAEYWANQEKDIVSACAGLFQCLSYNTKTRNLYYIYRVPRRVGKAVRYDQKINNILFSLSTVRFFITYMDSAMITKFINKIEKAVRADVPDVFVDPTYDFGFTNHTEHLNRIYWLFYKLIALILQHKLNKRIEWFTSSVFNHILNYTAPTKINNVLSTNSKILGKVRKVLSKKTSIKALAGLLYGKDKASICAKLLTLPKLVVNISKLADSMNHPDFPKSLYHYINQLVTSGKKTDMVKLGILCKSIQPIFSYNNHNDLKYNEAPLNQYIKYCRTHTDIPTWFMWVDMYSMAKRLSIRIRPNKLKEVKAVRELHDILANIINRDTRTITDYSDKIFDEFIVPNKLYNGFEFVQLRTAKELVHEGTTMHHCVGSYSPKCLRGQSIIFSMRKGGKSYVTIELEGKTHKLIQKYTISDFTVTNRTALATILAWQQDVHKLHINDVTSYWEICNTKFNEIAEQERAKNVLKLTSMYGVNNPPVIESNELVTT